MEPATFVSSAFLAAMNGSDEDDDGQFDGERVQLELACLRAGGAACVREMQLARTVGESRLVADELAECSVRLRRFTDQISGSGRIATKAPFLGDSLLSEVQAFVRDGMTADQLRVAAGRALESECLLDSKRKQVGDLKDKVAAAEADLQEERIESNRLELEVKNLRIALSKSQSDSKSRSSEGSASGPVPAVAHAESPGDVAATTKILPKQYSAQAVIENITHSRLHTYPSSDSSSAEASQDLKSTLGRALEKLSRDIYSTEGHFFEELIQNADDCAYPSHVTPCLDVLVTNSEISLIWNEVGFVGEDVAAICDLGTSTKTKARGHIGHKGIGFKSVFAVSDRPAIVSQDFSFSFDIIKHGLYGALVPIWSDREALVDIFPSQIQASMAGMTSFSALHLPLKDQCAGVSPTFDPATLLFLRRLKKITITEHNAHEDRNIVRSWTRLGGDAFSTHDRPASVSQCVTAGSCVTIREDTGAGCVSDTVFHIFHEQEDDIVLAFPVSSAVHLYPIFCHLPVQHVGLPFVLHGPWELTASRQSVRSDSFVNLTMRNRVAKLFAKAVSTNSELRENFFRYCPEERAVTESFWRPLCHAIRAELRNFNCFRTESGSWVSADKLIIRMDGMEFVTNDMLRSRFQMEFAAPAMTTEADDDAQERLRSFGVENFRVSQFVAIIADGRLDAPLRANPVPIFAALLRLWEDEDDGNAETLAKALRKLQIFPCIQNGSIAKVCLRSLADGPIFLPGLNNIPAGASFHVLCERERTASSPAAELFLRTMGLVEPNLRTIVKCILQKHRAGTVEQHALPLIWAELAYIKDNLNAVLRDDTFSLRELQTSLLIPNREGDLLLAEELHVASFLGLTCKHCSAACDEGLDAQPPKVAEFVCLRRCWEAVPSAVHIDSLIRTAGHGREKLLCHIVNAKPETPTKPFGVLSNVPAGQSRVRVDYALETEVAKGLCLGFAIESTSSEAFGYDLHSFGLVNGGLRYNGKLIPAFEDADCVTVFKFSPHCIISTCIDCDGLTAVFAKDGFPIYFGGGGGGGGDGRGGGVGAESFFRLPMHVFADAVLYPFHILTFGTLTVCFSKAVASQQLDDDGFLAFSAFHALSRSRVGTGSHTALMAASLPEQGSRETADAQTNKATLDWESFLLRLGALPHNKICIKRSYWASLVEGGDLGDCAICCTKLLGLSAAVAVPDCRHTFHANCLRRWLGNSKTCPVCRGHAEPSALVQPQADDDMNVLSALLTACIDNVFTEGNRDRQGHSLAALEAYERHGFTSGVLRSLPVTTSLGLRPLSSTFVRENFQRFGGSALPYVLPTVSHGSKKAISIIKNLGVAVLADVNGICHCITFLQHVLEKKGRELVPFFEQSEAQESNLSEDIDAVAACYGELWRLSSGSDAAARARLCHTRFACEPLIMSRNGAFVVSDAVVWDAPKMLSRFLKKPSIRGMYSSLKGFFLKTLAVAPRLTFHELVSASIELSDKQRAMAHSVDFETYYLRPKLNVSLLEAWTQLYTAYEVCCNEDGPAMVEQWLENISALPLLVKPRSNSNNQQVLDCKVHCFALADNDLHCNMFRTAFSAPDDALELVAPSFSAVLQKHGVLLRLSESVCEGEERILGPEVRLDTWSLWLEKALADAGRRNRALLQIDVSSVASLSRKFVFRGDLIHYQECSVLVMTEARVLCLDILSDESMVNMIAHQMASFHVPSPTMVTDREELSAFLSRSLEVSLNEHKRSLEASKPLKLDESDRPGSSPTQLTPDDSAQVDPSEEELQVEGQHEARLTFRSDTSVSETVIEQLDCPHCGHKVWPVAHTDPEHDQPRSVTSRPALMAPEPSVSDTAGDIFGLQRH